VQRAIDAQVQRSDRVRTKVYEAIRRGTLRIETADATVGQVNGLSVVQLGDFASGAVPDTATARLGDGKIIDIEREVELGAPSTRRAC